ncbi:interferon regulatory factor 3-like [Tachypleus tridentatus]|uniref:interferon regulatory factor 3-like n=1 Tax=Tachypleus tridentatus TaxID=6853 RepID=UPI003FCF4F92
MFKNKNKSCSKKRKMFVPWLLDLLSTMVIYGLEWIDKDKRIFKVPWKHASRKDWNQQIDPELYRLWVENTGKPIVPGFDFKRWKTNFRCALRSRPDIEEIREQRTKEYRVFQFTGNFNDSSNCDTSGRETNKTYFIFDEIDLTSTVGLCATSNLQQDYDPLMQQPSFDVQHKHFSPLEDTNNLDFMFNENILFAENNLQEVYKAEEFHYSHLIFN